METRGQGHGQGATEASGAWGTPPPDGAPLGAPPPEGAGTGVAAGKPRRSRKKLVLGIIGGALGICVLLGVIGSLIGGDDDGGDGDRDGSPVVAQSSATGTASQGAGGGADAQGQVTSTAATAGDEQGDGEGEEPAATAADEDAGSQPTATVGAEPTATTPAPTATTAPSTATVAPTPEPAAPGAERSNPIPFGQTGVTPDGNWEVQVLEVHRGGAAWERITAANMFNEAAPAGMEYVLASVRVKYLGSSAEAQGVGSGWFTLTGDARVRWMWASVVEPEPMLETELFSGGEFTGWTSVLARQDEGNLILIFEPLISSEEGDELFIALQEGATVPPPTERLAAENDLGFERDTPVPVGQRVAGEVWEVWVIESVRGEEALARLKEANMFNEDPAAGVEYVLVHVGARNISGAAGSEAMEQYLFTLTGAQNRVYDLPSLVEPEPGLSFDVYSGGEVSGWIALECAAGEANLRLIYEPLFSFSAQPRYFALE